MRYLRGKDSGVLYIQEDTGAVRPASDAEQAGYYAKDVGKGALRGAARGAVALPRMVEGVGQFVRGAGNRYRQNKADEMATSVGLQPGDLEAFPPEMPPEPILPEAVTQFGESLPEPQTAPGRVAEATAEGGVAGATVFPGFGTPTLLAAGLRGAARGGAMPVVEGLATRAGRVGMSALSGAAAGGAGQGAKEAGLGETGQTLASIAGGVVPGAVQQGVARMAERGAVARAPVVAEEVRNAPTVVRERAARTIQALFGDRGVPRKGMRSVEYADLMSRRQRALGALDTALGQYPAGEAPLPVQILEDHSTHLLARTKQEAASSSSFAERLGEQRRRAEGAVQARAAELRPEGQGTNVPASFAASATAERTPIREIYDAAESFKNTTVPLAPVLQRVRQLQVSASVIGERHMPNDIVSAILKDLPVHYPNGQVPVRELDDALSVLKAIQREGGREGVKAGELVGALDDGLRDAIEETGDTSLRDAHNAWRQYKQTYEPEMPNRRTSAEAVGQLEQRRIVDTLTRPGAQLSGVSKAGRPAEVARRLRNTLDQDALNDLQAGIWDELVDPALGGRTGTSLAKAENPRFREFYTATWGQPAYQRLHDLLEASRTVRLFGVGTAAEAERTGSYSLSSLGGVAEAMMPDRVKKIARLTRVDRALQMARESFGDPAANELVRLSLYDAQVFRDLLSLPRRGRGDWENLMRTHLARSAGRTAAMEATDQ